MESINNFRARFEVLEQQRTARGAYTRTAARRLRWWRGIACSLVVLGLLSWALPLGTAQDLLQQPSPPTQASEPKQHVTRPRPYGHLPLGFEANQGQTDDQVQFLAHGQGYTLFLTAREAVFAFRPSAAHGQRSTSRMLKLRAGQDVTASAQAVVRMQLLEANPAPQVVGLEELPGKSNYFIGNDPQKWRTNVPTYARVKYANVYPGVDLVYYGNQGQLEYDFVVQPGADPSRIALDIEASLVSAPGHPRGAPLRVAENGDLVMGTDGSEVVFRKPVVYQPATDSGQRTRDIVEGKYVIRAGQQVTFEIASYDKMRPLVIDPTLVYSTYLGGSNDDEAAAIAVDAAGHAYVTGATNSSNFPTTVGALQTATPGNIFISKLNAAGSALLYSTYLGSNEGERSSGIAVDAAGNVYVTGETSSSNFPTTPGAFQTTLNNGAAFVSKLNAAGSALLYSTFLDGTRDEGTAAIAVDVAGHAYVTGVTLSDDFPTTPGAFQTTPGPFGGNPQVAFVSKLNTTGSALVYSTYLGVTVTGGSGIAVDAAGHAYVTGLAGPDFPTTPGAFQTTPTFGEPFTDAFVTKLNTAGSALVYSTYLGLTFTGGSGIAVDAAGHAYVTGHTSFSNFPTTPGAFQTTFGGGFEDAFVSKLNATGSALLYSTYLGGSGNENEGGNGIAVDALGNAYITGATVSADFPTTPGAFQTTFGGGISDAFVSKLNTAGSTLLYSTYLGGSDIDNGTGIAVGAAGNAYITGYSFSSNFPTTPGAFQTTFFGEVVDAFVAKITVLTFAGTPGTPNCQGQSVSALAQQFGGLAAAATALRFPSVQALQDAIREFCEELNGDNDHHDQH